MRIQNHRQFWRTLTSRGPYFVMAPTKHAHWDPEAGSGAGTPTKRHCFFHVCWVETGKSSGCPSQKVEHGQSNEASQFLEELLDFWNLEPCVGGKIPFTAIIIYLEVVVVTYLAQMSYRYIWNEIPTKLVTLWLFNIAIENHHAITNGKPSISIRAMASMANCNSHNQVG